MTRDQARASIVEFITSYGLSPDDVAIEEHPQSGPGELGRFVCWNAALPGGSIVVSWTEDSA